MYIFNIYLKSWIQLQIQLTDCKLYSKQGESEHWSNAIFADNIRSSRCKQTYCEQTYFYFHFIKQPFGINKSRIINQIYDIKIYLPLSSISLTLDFCEILPRKNCTRSTKHWYCRFNVRTVILLSPSELIFICK